MVFRKEFDLIEAEDIRWLVSNQVPEGKVLDYKEKLVLVPDAEHKEFLADVSAFANASGGHLIYGVTEARDEAGQKTDLPGEAIGLSGVNANALILKLDGMLYGGIAPRIAGIKMKLVEGFDLGPVLIIYVPKSWTAPHMVTYRNPSRFYARGSGGKYELDVGELRSAFVLSEALPDRIRSFRADRIAQIVADEAIANMAAGPKLILHALPLSSFSQTSSSIDVVNQLSLHGSLLPLGVGSNGNRRNFDGWLTYSESDISGTWIDAYTQVYRDGRIEGVSARLVSIGPDGALSLPGYSYEQKIIAAVTDYVTSFKALQVEPPIFVLLTLVGVKGCKMLVSREYDAGRARDIDRDILTIPEVVIEDFETPVDQVLKAMFDVVWQSCGWHGSNNYENGRFVRH